MPKALLKIFLLWLGLLLVVGMASTHFSVYRQGTCNVKNQLPYYRWDSFWYTSIARHGYTFSETKNSSIAFFPFYPMVIKAGYEITHLRQDWLSFGMNIFFAAGLAWLLYRLVRFDYDEKISLAIVAVILFFPSSYFFLAGYPDVLFVLLVAMSLYLARQQKWAWAGLAAGLLAITKPYGIFMVPVLLLEYLQDNHWDWKVFYKKFDWLALLLPLVSFGGFLGFNFWKFGSPIAFLKTQQTWGRSLANPLAALWQEAQHYLLGGQLFSGSNFPYLIYLASFVFSLWAFWLAWSRVRKTWLLFSFLLLLSALLTGTLTSWGRYTLLAFPILLGPAIWLAKKKRVWLVTYLIFSTLVMLFCASFFVRCFPFE